MIFSLANRVFFVPHQVMSTTLWQHYSPWNYKYKHVTRLIYVLACELRVRASDTGPCLDLVATRLFCDSLGKTLYSFCLLDFLFQHRRPRLVSSNLWLWRPEPGRSVGVVLERQWLCGFKSLLIWGKWSPACPRESSPVTHVVNQDELSPIFALSLISGFFLSSSGGCSWGLPLCVCVCVLLCNFLIALSLLLPALSQPVPSRVGL